MSKGTCALFYAFLRAFAPMGSRKYAFLRGMRIPGGHFVCIFTWYPHPWGALCMRFYVQYGNPPYRICTFLHAIWQSALWGCIGNQNKSGSQVNQETG